MAALLLRHGIGAIAPRVERAIADARGGSHHLHDRTSVDSVHDAGFPANPQHRGVLAYFGDHAGAHPTCEMYGGLEAGTRRGHGLRLVHSGDASWLACHPAATTHRQSSSVATWATRIDRGSIRLNIGNERRDDTLTDRDQALARTGAR